MKTKGFTLLELLAAISVASALILTCGVIMQMGAKDRQSVTRELSWEREIGMAADHLKHDLTIAHRRVWHESRDRDSCQVALLTYREIEFSIQVFRVDDALIQCAVLWAQPCLLEVYVLASRSMASFTGNALGYICVMILGKRRVFRYCVVACHAFSTNGPPEALIRLLISGAEVPSF